MVQIKTLSLILSLLFNKPVPSEVCDLTLKSFASKKTRVVARQNLRLCVHGVKWPLKSLGIKQHLILSKFFHLELICISYTMY